jgi:hypothetical protein
MDSGQDEVCTLYDTTVQFLMKMIVKVQVQVQGTPSSFEY